MFRASVAREQQQIVVVHGKTLPDTGATISTHYCDSILIQMSKSSDAAGREILKVSSTGYG
jgi:hypothetical protein